MTHQHLVKARDRSRTSLHHDVISTDEAIQRANVSAPSGMGLLSLPQAAIWCRRGSGVAQAPL